ncbi:NACHT domain-containing protein [Amycolatopsis sp., V23-08]|uniref:NACHT domain-containing protein n=1 Tax=Amycolatopsis heterodermiae TaxID=3110235 RepID=A0ABU5R984_9PSEU|nr:NACHT domain-containing protein [Amycolatopsis sp., V23-08]MEA5362786.1 NACHT domain-containing protein [Amycolatopsis sp., V23-08]
MSIDALAIALTTAMMKATAKIWLGDRSIAADASAKVFDLLEKQVTGLNDRRKLRLLLTNIEDRIADRLLPFIEVEFRQLPENECAAALVAARETFDRAALTDEDLFQADLDAVFLYRYLLRAVPGVPREFLISADATELYHRILRECCAYLVQVTSTLPQFQSDALVRVLRRETEILEAVRNALTAMPQRRHPDDFAADFRRQVVSVLDRMELFGADLPGATRLYPLSVAYLSLSVRDNREGASVDRFEHVLPLSSRILLRGEAGSGKTTILQWLAVQCASRQLQRVNGWANVEPFLLRLRRFADSALPAPERFLDEIGRHIADEMPVGWVQQLLRGGGAVVLVDGIDELPAERRSGVRRWLDELISHFPLARYVVTTRPTAVEPDWLAHAQFVEVTLQPMTSRDVRTFVERWHAAMPDKSLDDRRDALVTTINTSTALRRLSENPLLCALLCALHHAGNGHLPGDRMELYDVALRMLLDRRDVERQVENDVRLKLTEKLVLLRRLAYWMVRNGHTDIPTEDAEARIASALMSMQQVNAGSSEVFQHLLTRGGVLREPVRGRIDFVHRTFGEYLAAKAAVDEDDIGVLVENAHRDEWRDVVVLAAGHATPKQRVSLVDGVLSQGVDTFTRSLVALACLETSPELPGDLREKVKARASSYVPPRDIATAEQLAAAGEFALDLIAGAAPADDPEVAAATVRAAALIGGPAALEFLTQFRGQTASVVVDELARAHARFEPAEFCERVLADCTFADGLSVNDPDMLTGLERLNHLYKLTCLFSRDYVSLEFVHRLPRLRELLVASTAGFELRALTGAKLTHIALLSNSQAPAPSKSVNVAPLCGLRKLARLSVEVNTYGWEFLCDLPDLRQLAMQGIHANQLAQLAPFRHIREFHLENMAGLRNLESLSFLDGPVALTFRNCRELKILSQLARWSESLTRLQVSACPVEDWSPLAQLARLRSLEIGATQSVDLSLLSDVQTLEELSLDSNQVDLSPLAGRRGLTVWIKSAAEVSGEDMLGPGSQIGRY